MKKKTVFIFVLFVLVLMPFQLFAQDSDVFRQTGIASWYGREFEGRPTASGEIFNSSQLTAAHPSLPFGTMLVVTNQHNNKSVVVRVNDRGPFVPVRILDVSRAAAEQLDMIVTGTAPVSVVSIDRAVMLDPTIGVQVLPQESVVEPVVPVTSVASAAPVTSVAPVAPVVPVTPVASVVPVAPVVPVTPVVPVRVVPETVQSVSIPEVIPQPVVVQRQPQFVLRPSVTIINEKSYRLQIGSYRNARNAVEAFERLKNVGLSPNYERFTDNSDNDFYRVVIAGVLGSNVQSVTESICSAGFAEAWIREEN